jgi:hypothetical protein
VKQEIVAIVFLDLAIKPVIFDKNDEESAVTLWGLSLANLGGI